MSFTPESSLESMSRLGRTTNLLERKRLDNGNTLSGRVLSFIKKNQQTGGLLTILGHPSAGKTTEFNRLARELSSTQNIVEDYYPLYTELQNAELADGFISSEFIWKGIVSGSIDIQLHGEDASQSLESFCNHCKEFKKTPLLMIDTLDILMLHQVGSDDIDVAKLWADFLQSVVDNQVLLVWTCRPFEWKYFQREINKSYAKMIEIENLPLLSKDQLKPFSEMSSLALTSTEDDDLHEYPEFSSLFGNNADDPPSENKTSLKIRKDGWPEQEAWEKWTINFQSHMPIFADRWNSSTKTSKRLDDDLFAKFATDFRKYTSSELNNRHWYEFVKELPSQYLYSWIWDKISKRMEETYELDLTLINELRDVLENESKNTALNNSNNSSRIRLEYNVLLSVMVENLNINEVSVNDFFNVCESRGLLTRNGIWVDFTHQLLFEEALLRKSDDDDLEKLQNFPSILLRTKKDVTSFTKAEEILRDEVLNAIGNWTGYMLSFHPSCISEFSNLEPTWSKWVDYARNNKLHASLKVPDLDFNEETEKRIALNLYEQSDGVKSLLVNGAPGTGKTYFCRDYLKWALAKMRNSNKPLKWRYYTLNNHLAEHFDELVEELSNQDPYMSADLKRSEGGSFAIDRLLRHINPDIKRKKSVKGKGNIGLLTFSIFKILIRDYFGQTKVKHSGAKCPPLADAWSLYNQIIHDPVSGKMASLDKKGFQKLNSQSYKMKPSAIQWFLKFHDEKLKNYWWTYSYAAFNCRERLAKMDSNKVPSIKARVKVAESKGDKKTAEKLRRDLRETYEIDLLIVDEVQDINPPVMALLLELMRPGFANHSIMIAGDMIQTVNRSGFDWIKFSEFTAKSLKDSNHPNKSKLIQFGVFDKNELESHRTTLKYVWRNGKRLVEFNNKLRKNYAESFGISEDYSSRFDYPGGELLISKASITKDKESEITVIEADSINDYHQLIEQLSEDSKKLVGGDVAVLAPFEIEDEWNEKFKVPVYDAESVKGLEFESIVVLMPYMIPENEARSSLIRQLGDSEGEIQNQIQKWCDSWKENTGDESYKNFENFNQLFLNVMTRMNVLFSRPEKRILIINPVSFGKGVQIYDRNNGTEKMMSFGMPKLPENVKINRRNGMSIFNTLNVPISKNTPHINYSYKKLLSKALSQAGLNDDGTQTDNERKVWDNLWHNLKDNDSAPLSAIAYAGGLEYRKNLDSMRLLRADLGRGFTLNPSSIRDRENQLIAVLRSVSSNQNDIDFQIEPTKAHYVFANLESLIRKIMVESHEHEKLHQFMMLRLFGVDVTEINDYDFERFIQEHISIENLSLEEFSEGIPDPETQVLGQNQGMFVIKSSTKKFREIILRHLNSRTASSGGWVGMDVNGIIELPEWDDESNSLWSEITKCIEDGDFDSDIVNNSNNYSLLKWMEWEFKTRKPSRGQIATNRKSWEGIITENKISPMHLSAWTLLTKVITKIHDYRSQFTPKDEFYLSVYDALDLSIDLSGMRIFHEVLENSISEENLLNFDEKYNAVTKKYSEVFDKGKHTLPSMLKQLERHWLVRDVDRTSHKFKTSRGASIIGAMIHASYLMKTQWANSLKRSDSILGTIEKQLTKYYNTSTKGLHLNVKEYWLKYHLQDPLFRELLSKILDSEKDIYTAQLEGTIPKFLSKLLMIDFVAMTDKNWKSPSRRGSGINGFTPDFSGSSVDGLTLSIVSQCDKFLSPTGSRFFSTFIDDLDNFLDLDKIDIEYKKRASAKGQEDLDKLKFKKRYPNKYINRDLWMAWEWLLRLMSSDFGSGLYDRWTGMHEKQNIDAIKLRKVRRNSLHNYLRMNSDDGYDYIQEQVYRNQYLSIKNDLLTAKEKSFIFHTNNLLDFCEGTINKSNIRFNWTNPQRIILNHAIKERGYPVNYIDWDICYQLFSRLNSEINNDIEDFLESAILNLRDGLGHIINKGEGKHIQLTDGLVTTEDLVNYSSNHKTSAGRILEFSSRLKNAHILLKDTLNMDSQDPNTPNRIKKSYFNSDRLYQNLRDIIGDKLIQYVMGEIVVQDWSIRKTNKLNSKPSQYSGETLRFYEIMVPCKYYNDCRNRVPYNSNQTHCKECCVNRFESCEQKHVE